MEGEKRDFRELYEKIVGSDWFKRAYKNKSLGVCPVVIDELELTETEEALYEMVTELYGFDDLLTLDEYVPFVKRWAKSILGAARKQLFDELDAMKADIYNEGYWDGYKKGMDSTNFHYDWPPKPLDLPTNTETNETLALKNKKTKRYA